MKTSVHVVRTVNPAQGGMSSCVPALALATSGTGRCSDILVDFCAADAETPISSSDGTRLRLSWQPWRMYTTKTIPGELHQIISKADVVHIHGLWQPYAFAAAKLAQEYRKPYVVSAHGMLEPWALRNKRWKKIPYSVIVQRPSLKTAACLRALTHNEAEDYRRYGIRSPIAIIPNGVDAPPQLSRELFLTMFPKLRQRQLVLFLSRIHYKKGLDILIQAWSRLQPRFPDAHLVLAGPDFENTKASIEADIASLGLAEHVTFTGMLNKTEKWSALAASDAFVLPSYSEGFSMAILEAMAAGLPVIATRQCYFPEIRAKECGWVIEPSSSQLQAALSDCLRASAKQRTAMGQRGKMLASESYSWRCVGNKMADVVDWVVDGRLPSSVEIIQ